MDQVTHYINNNKWDRAAQLLGDKLDRKIINGNSIYHIACIRGDREAMELLRNKGADITKPNQDGNTAYHLLAQNGWLCASDFDSDQSLNQSLNQSLTKINNSYQTVADLSMHDRSLLERIIDRMIDNKQTHIFRLDNVPTVYGLIDLIMNDSSYVPILNRILSEYDSIDFQTHIPILIYAARKNNLPALKELLRYPHNQNAKDFRFNNALQYAIKNENPEMARLLLEDRIDPNYGSVERDRIPLVMAIEKNNRDLIGLLLRHKASVSIRDKYHNTPLHYFILSHSRNPYDKKMVRRFVKKGDLTIPNSYGITPTHLLIQTKLWKDLDLADKDLDVSQLDMDGKNSLAYLDQEELPEFMQMLEDKRKRGPIQIRSIPHVRMDRGKREPFGLFNSDVIHGMIYMMRIFEKYSVIAPFQYPIKDREIWDGYALSLQESDWNAYTKIMHSILDIYQNLFYPIAPYIILWRNRDTYYIHPHVKMYLRKVGLSDARHIIMKLTLIPHTSGTHANMILYDKTKKDLRRFEPYGTNDILDGDVLDQTIHELFESVFGKTTYYRPDSYLNDVIFQSISGDSDDDLKNMGDPVGYCLAWCIWFLETKLKNPDTDDKTLFDNAKNQMIDQNKSTNLQESILSYIRGYARSLDRYKNRFLENIGVNKMELYAISHHNLTIDRISQNVNKKIISLFTKSVDVSTE